MQQDDQKSDSGPDQLQDGAEPKTGGEGARIVFLSESPDEATEEAAELSLKERIAERVRSDCRDHGILTSEQALVSLLPGQHDAISAALAEMGKDHAYKDIKAITTASGLVFFYSENHFKVAEAAAKSLLEEVKFRIGEKVRADSRESERLTAVDPLYDEIGWEKGNLNPDEIQKDPRYADIKTVAAATGELFFFSDRYMGAGYARVLARAAGKDPCATVAETVRDESRIYPRPTCVLRFLETAYSIQESELKTVVEKMLERPEFDDIRLIVHPTTGGVYLYSIRHLDQRTAESLMDWEEVGRDANP